MWAWLNTFQSTNYIDCHLCHLLLKFSSHLLVGSWEILVDCWFLGDFGRLLGDFGNSWEILVTEGLSANSPRSNQPSLSFQLTDPISSTANIALRLTISKMIIRKKTFATIMGT